MWSKVAESSDATKALYDQVVGPLPTDFVDAIKTDIDLDQLTDVVDGASDALDFVGISASSLLNPTDTVAELIGEGASALVGEITNAIGLDQVASAMFDGLLDSVPDLLGSGIASSVDMVGTVGKYAVKLGMGGTRLVMDKVNYATLLARYGRVGLQDTAYAVCLSYLSSQRVGFEALVGAAMAGAAASEAATPLREQLAGQWCLLAGGSDCPEPPFSLLVNVDADWFSKLLEAQAKDAKDAKESGAPVNTETQKVLAQVGAGAGPKDVVSCADFLGVRTVGTAGTEELTRAAILDPSSEPQHLLHLFREYFWTRDEAMQAVPSRVDHSGSVSAMSTNGYLEPITNVFVHKEGSPIPHTWDDLKREQGDADSSVPTLQHASSSLQRAKNADKDVLVPKTTVYFNRGMNGDEHVLSMELVGLGTTPNSAGMLKREGATFPPETPMSARTRKMERERADKSNPLPFRLELGRGGPSAPVTGLHIVEAKLVRASELKQTLGGFGERALQGVGDAVGEVGNVVTAVGDLAVVAPMKLVGNVVSGIGSLFGFKSLREPLPDQERRYSLNELRGDFKVLWPYSAPEIMAALKNGFLPMPHPLTIAKSASTTAGSFLYARTGEGAPLVDVVAEVETTGIRDVMNELLAESALPPPRSDPSPFSRAGAEDEPALANARLVEWVPMLEDANGRTVVEQASTAGAVVGAVRGTASFVGGEFDKAGTQFTAVGRGMQNAFGANTRIRFVVRHDYTIYWDDLQPTRTLAAGEKMWLNSKELQELRTGCAGGSALCG